MQFPISDIGKIKRLGFLKLFEHESTYLKHISYISAVLDRNDILGRVGLFLLVWSDSNPKLSNSPTVSHSNITDTKDGQYYINRFQVEKNSFALMLPKRTKGKHSVPEVRKSQWHFNYTNN